MSEVYRRLIVALQFRKWGPRHPYLLTLVLVVLLFTPPFLALFWLVSLIQGPLDWVGAGSLILLFEMFFVGMVWSVPSRQLQPRARTIRALSFSAICVSILLIYFSIFGPVPGSIATDFFFFLVMFVAFFYPFRYSSWGQRERAEDP